MIKEERSHIVQTLLIEEINRTEQRVLFIPETELQLDDGWHVVSAKSHHEPTGEVVRPDGKTAFFPIEVGVSITIRRGNPVSK